MHLMSSAPHLTKPFLQVILTRGALAWKPCRALVTSCMYALSRAAAGSFPDTPACSGAHTLGRSYPHRSGFGKESTKYTKDGPGTKDGTKGGSSWTVDWLKFDNSYFRDIKEQRDSELLVLETDDVLFRDEGFRCAPCASTHTLSHALRHKTYAVAASP